MTMRQRLRLMRTATWPTVVIFAVLAVAFTLLGANWPERWSLPPTTYTEAQLALMRKDSYHRIGLQDFLIFTYIIAFLNIKNTIMEQRMGKVVDWVTITLVVVNYAFAMLYLLVISGALFPYWFATHQYWGDKLTDLVRMGVVISLTWGTWTLTGIPEPHGTDAKGRKLGYYPVEDEQKET